MAMLGRTFQADGYKYGYNGKEKDDEIKGNGDSYDFGARMYDPRLGRWLALDPLAKDYAPLSPYSFVGNTPIMAIDPDGKKIVIVYRDDDGKKQKFVYQPGVQYEGDNKFVQQAVTALNYVKPGDVEQLIQKVSDSEKTVKIKQTSLGRDKYIALTNTVKWNPTGGILIQDENGIIHPECRQSPAIGLFHEIGHGFIDLFTSFGKKIKDYLTESNSSNEAYDDPEEEKIITKWEAPASIILGEDYRTGHDGMDYETKGPTTTEEAEPINKDGIEKYNKKIEKDLKNEKKDE